MLFVRFPLVESLTAVLAHGSACAGKLGLLIIDPSISKCKYSSRIDLAHHIKPKPWDNNDFFLKEGSFPSIIVLCTEIE